MEFNFQITPGSKSLYQNGVDFLKAAERCLGMDDNGKVTIADNGVFRTLAAPAVVNATFACEMFFKSLISKSGKTYPTGRNGHDLKHLYELLPKTVQNFLYRSPGNNYEDREKEFVTFLETHSNDFVNVRYYVTHEGWQGMSPIIVYTYTFNIWNKTKYLLSNWETVVNG